MKTFYTSVNKP